MHTDKMDSQEIYHEWCNRSATLGRHVRISSVAGDFDGEAVSLSEDGALMVKASGNLLRVVAGDCIHLETCAEGRRLDKEKGSRDSKRYIGFYP